MSFNEKEANDLRSVVPYLEANLDLFRGVLRLIGTYAAGEFSDNRFKELKEICKVVLNNVPFMLTLLDPTYIARARKNEKPIFSKAAEISYNPNLATVTQGRFNLAGESAFYGSLPTFHEDGKLINYRNQCPMFEVCKELSSGQGMRFPVYFTLGFWKIARQLPVLNLCYDKDHLTTNPALNIPVSAFIANVKKETSAKAFAFILDVWEYFSGLARSWDKQNETNNYYILTAFYHAFKETYKASHASDSAGIIYPSAMTEAKGLNIVLSPEGVEEHLQLAKVQMYLLRSRGLPYDYEPMSNGVDVIDNTFVFDKKMLFWYNMAMQNWDQITGFEG